MRIYRVSDIRTDNYIVVSGSRTTAPFIIQEEWSIIINVCVRATLLHNCLCKALSAPNRACTAVPDKDIIHAVTRENRGLWSVCIGILKCRERIVIQFTDFKSGNYHRGLSSNFRVGSNQIPLCSSQKRKAAYIPRKIEAASVRVQICSRKIPDTGRAVPLCKVTFQIEP